MNVKKKGRNFELSIYNQLRTSIPSIRLSKWSGCTQDEPGDIFGNNIIIDTKHYSTYTDGTVRTWISQLEEEAKRLPTPHIPIIIARANHKPIKVYIKSSHLLYTFNDIVSFHFPSCIPLIAQLEHD